MAKNIVFCADGTWKGLGQGNGGDELQADATNVLRLFAALAGAVTPDSLCKQDEQEKAALGPDGGATRTRCAPWAA
jgi:glutathione S-transferase